MFSSLRLTNFVLQMMYKQLISEQRYTISVLLQRKCTLKFIAETIKVSVSTVSREIKRNSNEKGVYNAHLAVLRTKRRRAKTPGNRSIGQHVRTRVFGLIRNEQWSPEQIAGRLKTEEGINVSKSTIYNWISSCTPHYRDSIHKSLRRGGKKTKRNAGQGRTNIPDRISIDERPTEADGRTLGDWEMDTIVGKNGKGVILTLVERKSCFMLMEKLETGKRAEPLADTVVRMLRSTELPVRSITTDNGTEFAAHKIIASNLNTKVYFAHPYSSWEKGAIENMNGLIRQYIPKKTDLNGISKAYIKQIMDKLNNRPRKKNDFNTPNEMIMKFFK